MKRFFLTKTEAYKYVPSFPSLTLVRSSDIFAFNEYVEFEDFQSLKDFSNKEKDANPEWHSFNDVKHLIVSPKLLERS